MGTATSTLDSGLTGTRDDITARLAAETRSWAALAVGSLAIAGAIALLLAISRVPGSDRLLAWPIGFFRKGLVIHVVFSLVIWFLAMFGAMTCEALRTTAAGRVRLVGIGRHGVALVALAFPLLLLPAFRDDSIASLNNYVPVLVHRAYYAGLMLLALGALLPAVRLIANVPALRQATRQDSRLPPMVLAGLGASIIYIVALICVGLALRWCWGGEPTRALNEQLFWGAGHVLQFLSTVLLLAGWQALARESLGQDIFDPEIFGIAVKMVTAMTLAAPIFYLVLKPFSIKQTEAFRLLQFGLALPTLLVAVNGLVTLLSARGRRGLPWRDPAFLALGLSAAMFAAGGVMGLVITGSDTRTPAHYHCMIAAVSVVLMALLMTVVLPSVGCGRTEAKRVRWLVALFGGGQLAASLGLFLAGGFGAPRKLPGGAALVDGAVVGMYLNGLGALMAVAGGALFVGVAGASLLRATSSGRRAGA